MKHVLRMQRRIVDLFQQKKEKEAHSLQKLLLHSYDAWRVVIFHITKENQGRATPGVDEKIILTDEERVQCLTWLRTVNIQHYAAPGIRRVYIPKSNGKLRPLGIPTIKDRIVQDLVRMALEPEWETRFPPRSTGFRPHLSCHHAIYWLARGIRGLTARGALYVVIDADIKACFDNIAHEPLLALIQPYFRPVIRRWLKAPVHLNGGVQYPARGTPQGGVISPLLANIALNGIESLPAKRNGLFPYTVRYADDLVVLTQDYRMLRESQRQLAAFLASRGLEINAEKTRYLRGVDPYKLDFLGFTFTKRRSGIFHPHLVIQPNKEKVKKHYHRLKEIVNKNKASTQADLIRQLNPVIRGYANYYKHCHCARIMGRLDHLLVWKLWKWCQRRHKHKNKAWLRKKYWSIEEGKQWVFTDGVQRLDLHYEDAAYEPFSPGPVWANPYSDEMWARAGCAKRRPSSS